jgi:integrase
MSDAVAAELQAMKKKRKAEYLAKGSNTIPEWVFMSRGRLLKPDKPGEEKRGDPERVDMHNVEVRHFVKCLAKAGLRRIRFHDLRHTFATLLLMQGESPVYVKEQLGHSSIKVTGDIYGHWIPGANRAAVNKLPTLSQAAKSISKAASAKR